jgi:hypothetical protein
MHWSEKDAKWIGIAFPLKWSADPMNVNAWQDIILPKIEETALPVSREAIEVSVNREILCAIDEYDC